MERDKTKQETCRISSEDVIFSEASADQLTAVWTLNAAAWADPISTEDHIERERELSQQPASGERWTTWILTPKTDSTEIVASVETFARPLFVGDGNGCRTETGYGIASVFTNPKYRGNRMANVLLSRLKDWLDGEGAGWVSVLYSDIGADFYARQGWIPGSTSTLILETDLKPLDAAHDQNADSFPGIKPLQDEDLKTLCGKDSEYLQSGLDQLSSTGKTYFAFEPRFETISWHWKREDLNAQFIHGHVKTRFRGAVTESGNAWMIWHFDEVEHKLKVQRIVVLNKNEQDKCVQEVASLIGYAQLVANSSTLPTILIWNPTETTIAAAELLVQESKRGKLRLEQREGSIPAARRRHGAAQNDLVWEANEYYAWC